MVNRDYNMKSRTKRTNFKDKYLKESFKEGAKIGSGNISPHGEINNRGSGRGMRGGNSCIDPKNAITEMSHGVRIKGEIIMGHYNVNGLPVKGPMKINNLRIYDGSKLVGKLQLIALTSNIQDNEWLNEKRALLIDEYINYQELSHIKRGYGFVYEHSFFNIK